MYYCLHLHDMQRVPALLTCHPSASAQVDVESTALEGCDVAFANYGAYK